MTAVDVFHVLFGIALVAMTVALYVDLRNMILKRNDDDKNRKE